MGGTRGTFTIQEFLEGKAEENWRRNGVPEKRSEFSRLSGMDAGEIRGFRKFTGRHPGYLSWRVAPNLPPGRTTESFRPSQGMLPRIVMASR